MGDFDVVVTVRDLERRIRRLEAAVEAREALSLDRTGLSASMDAGKRGAKMEGLPARVRRALAKAGFVTPELVGQLTDEELLRIEGIGPEAVKAIRSLGNG